MTADDFAAWLWKEMQLRQWSKADLSRHTKISSAQITRILNGDRQAGNDALLAIAKAFHLPPDQVFKKAGILPDNKTQEERLDEEAQEIKRLMTGLSEETVDEIKEYIRMRRRIMDERAKYDTAQRKPHHSGT